MTKTIGEACKRDVVSATPGATVVQAAELMRRHHAGNAVVVEKVNGVDVPIGIVTDRDIVVEVVAAGADPRTVTVGELLPRRLEAIDERETTGEAIRRMSLAGVRRLPVVDLSGALVGIVSVDDLLPELATQLFMLTDVANRGRRAEAAARG